LLSLEQVSNKTKEESFAREKKCDSCFEEKQHYYYSIILPYETGIFKKLVTSRERNGFLYKGQYCLDRENGSGKKIRKKMVF